MGYTPVFDSVFTGTLCGKYPDTAAWLFLLALADKNGVVDMTPQYIANVTGMPVTDLIECLARFEQPDPYSRTMDCDGRRITRIEESRPWGWKIVNHGKYREKARKAAFDAERVASGENRQRMQGRRENGPDATRDDPTRPASTRADPLSDSDSDSDANKDLNLKKSMSASPTAVPREADEPDANREPDDTGQVVARVFAHWRETFGHPRARLDAKRRKLIRARLKDGYSEADLCQSISGYRNSPHHMGRNDRNTVYDDLNLLLRDSGHVDAGLRFYADPPCTDLSAQTRRIIDQTADWQPPEVRRAAN